MYHVIVNPASKSGLGQKIWTDIKPIFDELNVPFKEYKSGKIGDVIKLTEQICGSTPESETINLLVLGGDGTLDEAINGIDNFDRVNIGYIPTGSSNDFARDMDYSEEPGTILRKILSGKYKKALDLGVLTYKNASNDLADRGFTLKGDTRYFLVSSGIGFDAAVCEEALFSKLKSFLNKFKLGKLTYGVIGLKQIFTAQKIPCEIIFDDKRKMNLDKFLFIAGMNTRFEGGGYMFGPDAVPNDGILQFCVVGSITKLKYMFALPLAMKGTHARLKGIEIVNAAKAEIKTSAPMWVHTDGEVYSRSNHIIISVLKQKLNFLY